ncbi:MAG: 7-cyano-7-deazaguanine synthase QueC [Puniceicoccales bacterium]|jgi:7-cyano-7-deazaguanine synthase|nr:7-cyano-7-deazaguanine synthase QueC [Puniceicoccales bacterium]
MNPPEKSVVILSGGLDSTVLLAKLVADGRRCLALTFNYGQRHAREIEAARAIAAALGVEHTVGDLRGIAALFGSNCLTDAALPVPDGHYTEERMKATVVPGRNLLFLSAAAALAFSRGCDTVAYGAHGGDHAIYPDCRPEFANALEKAIALADWHHVALERPFVSLTKADIVRLGAEIGAPLELTWSCYRGGDTHCGRCGTCVERREAFALAGVPDPTEYASE